MIALSLDTRDDLTVLAFGAHSDDIEIGAGGTLLRLAEAIPRLRVHVVVATGSPERADEARRSAHAFVAPVVPSVDVHDLPDGRLPGHWSELKDAVEAVARRVHADVVIGPGPYDAHQDHRTLGEILPTVFRDHWLLQYEIPKWDGDLGSGHPTHFVPLSPELMRRKSDLLLKHFPSQSGRDWFSAQTFEALARLRGMECRSAYAEAFHIPKSVIDFANS